MKFDIQFSDQANPLQEENGLTCKHWLISDKENSKFIKSFHRNT